MCTLVNKANYTSIMRGAKNPTSFSCCPYVLTDWLLIHITTLMPLVVCECVWKICIMYKKINGSPKKLERPCSILSHQPPENQHVVLYENTVLMNVKHFE